MEEAERRDSAYHIARAGPHSIRQPNESSEPVSQLKSVLTFASSTVSSSNSFTVKMWTFFKKAFSGLLSTKRKSRRNKGVKKDDISHPHPSEETPLLTDGQNKSPTAIKRCSGVSRRNRAPPAARIERQITPVAVGESIQVYPPQRNRHIFAPGARFVFESQQSPQHYAEEPAVIFVNDRSGQPCAGITLSFDLSQAMQNALKARRQLRALEHGNEHARDVLFAREKEIIEEMRSLSRELSRLRLEDADNIECTIAVKQEIRDNERQHNALLERNDVLEKELVEAMKEQNCWQEKIDEILDAVFVDARLLQSPGVNDVPEKDADYSSPVDDGALLPVALDLDQGAYIVEQSEITNPYFQPEVVFEDFDGEHAYQDEQSDYVDADDDNIMDDFYYDDKSRILAWQESVPVGSAEAGAEEHAVDADRKPDEWDVRSVGMASINGIALGVTRFRIDTYEKLNALIRAEFEAGLEPSD